MKGDSWKHVYEHEDEVTELLLSVDYRYLEEFICGDLPSRVYGSPGWDVRATKAFEVAFEPTNAPGAYINTLCEKEYVQDPEAASNDSAFELNPAFATAEGGGEGEGSPSPSPSPSPNTLATRIARLGNLAVLLLVVPSHRPSSSSSLSLGLRP
jgi:hypothetical protein